MKIKIKELRNLIESEIIDELKIGIRKPVKKVADENQKFVSDDGKFDIDRCAKELKAEKGISNPKPACHGAAIVYTDRTPLVGNRLKEEDGEDNKQEKSIKGIVDHLNTSVKGLEEALNGVRRARKVAKSLSGIENLDIFGLEMLMKELWEKKKDVESLVEIYREMMGDEEE